MKHLTDDNNADYLTHLGRRVSVPCTPDGVGRRRTMTVERMLGEETGDCMWLTVDGDRVITLTLEDWARVAASA